MELNRAATVHSKITGLGGGTAPVEEEAAGAELKLMLCLPCRCILVRSPG